MIEKFRSPVVQEFIQQHQHDDPAMLMLQSGKYPHLPMKEVVWQIQSLQKARQKLPEWHQHKNIIFPPPLSIEQCSSETTAKFKASLIAGDSFVDLTGGTGIDTYYLSKVFIKVHFVERNSMLCEVAAHNFSILAADIEIHNKEAADFLSSMKKRVDFIYIDPARRSDSNSKVFLLEDCEPDVSAIREELFNQTEKVLIKTSPMLDIQLAENALQNVKQVFILSVGNEVKEVLYLLEKDYTEPSKINAVSLDKIGEEKVFSFLKTEEQQAESNFSLPLKYIYEPNSAILKAGAFKLLGERFGLSKLHIHSHLYTSNQLVSFPGRVFKCVAVVPYSKKAILPHLPDKKANISTRNFPDTVRAVRKKTGIKEGGTIFLFATTNMEDKLTILICRKVALSDA